ncbi:NHL repeat-containing protein [Pedobacter caeni]|uniref:NHL repeat-containing protein n=1 Tax=Pedobacter caeni TaxID=288992 RepID=A0A1M5H3X4_9SPHI|nr:hypothetical protein [Pedobacter caeni]SHG10741.1 NHL repeat-containing protein [Pedobacter caeni]
MKQVKLALVWGALLLIISSCKKGEKIDEPILPKVLMVSSFAGGEGNAYLDGPKGVNAFYQPNGITTDLSGNMYVADKINCSIRKITPDGTVTTIAGKGGKEEFEFAGLVDGTGANARFRAPTGIRSDASGNLYVVDQGNNCIRKITSEGVVTTLAGGAGNGFADGPGATAKFNNPQDIAVDVANNLYVTDYGNNRIRKITPAGVVSTYAGTGVQSTSDGPIATARVRSPFAINIDPTGIIYFSEESGGQLRKIADGIVTTLVPFPGYVDGPVALAAADKIAGIAIDAKGDVYVSDQNNALIRKVSFINGIGVIKTIAGIKTTSAERSLAAFKPANGFADQTKFVAIFGLTIDKQENLYVADAGRGGQIKKISLETDPRVPQESKETKDARLWNKPIGWK